MEPWLAILIIVAAVASRPIEVRLWRAGRLSDRTLTLLLVGRFPVVLGLYALLTGGLSLLTLFVIASSLLPSLLLYRFVLYRFVLDLIREQAAQRQEG
jgi:hypothetical protein